jgi:hypothetical protein
MSDIHSCSYYCDRPACIKAQRDELRDRFQVMQAQAEVVAVQQRKSRGEVIPLCGVCKEPQFETPSGVTCVNGHGGADPLEEPV